MVENKESMTKNKEHEGNRDKHKAEKKKIVKT